MGSKEELAGVSKRLREGRTPGSELRWTVAPIHIEAADHIDALEASHTAARTNFLTMQGAAAVMLKRAETAEAKLAVVEKALSGAIAALARYDQALANREHGGVAAHHCVDDLRQALSTIREGRE